MYFCKSNGGPERYTGGGSAIKEIHVYFQMKAKFLNLLLIATSLLGYLEWGGNNSSFLFQSEYDVLTGVFTDPKSVAHPFTIIPIIGQFLLLITLFQKKPGAIITYTGIASLGLLLGFMLFIGIIGPNFKILLSTLPFLTIAVYTLFYFRRENKNNPTKPYKRPDV